MSLAMSRSDGKGKENVVGKHERAILYSQRRKKHPEEAELEIDAEKYQVPPRPDGDTGRRPLPPSRHPCSPSPCAYSGTNARYLLADGGHRGRRGLDHDQCLHENHCRSKKRKREAETRTDLMLQQIVALSRIEMHMLQMMQP